MAARECRQECMTIRECRQECMAARACRQECKGARECRQECMAARECRQECMATRECRQECMGTRKCRQQCMAARNADNACCVSCCVLKYCGAVPALAWPGKEEFCGPAAYYDGDFSFPPSPLPPPFFFSPSTASLQSSKLCCGVHFLGHLLHGIQLLQ